MAGADSPDYQEAEARLAVSLKLFEAGEARVEAARTQAVWGKVLQARGNVEAAREHFEKAAAQFQETGLTSELERTKWLIDSLQQ